MRQERKFEKINHYFFMAYMTLCAVLVIYYGFLRDGYHFSIALGALALPPAYLLLMRALHLERSAQLDFVLLAFTLLAYPFGSVMEFYSAIPNYDKLCHTLAGVLSSMMVFGLFLYFDPKHGVTEDNRMIAMLFAFLGSMAIAGMWELCEYGVWAVTGRDVQKVQSTGINDTMQDMLVHLLGTIVYLPSVWKCVEKRNNMLVAAPMEFVARNVSAFPCGMEYHGNDGDAVVVVEEPEVIDVQYRKKMCYDEVLQEVVQVIQGVLPQTVHSAITGQTSLQNDLCFDSMSLIFLILEMEIHFGIEADWDFAADTPAAIADSVFAALRAAEDAAVFDRTCEPRIHTHFFCGKTA